MKCPTPPHSPTESALLFGALGAAAPTALRAALSRHLSRRADTVRDWIDVDEAVALLRPSPPSPSPLGALLQRASRLAAGSDKASASPALIFDLVELDNPHAPPARHWPLRPLPATDVARADPLPIFARPGPANAEHEAEHERRFIAALNAKAERWDWNSFQVVFSHLLALWNEWGWCLIPRGMTGCSLTDHARLTAAIALCLHRAQGHSGAPFCLLAGDVSGIQKYIFDISTLGAGGVAKRLRARSFAVAMLSECAALRLLAALDLPTCNLLLAAGGNFLILAPNTDATSTCLEHLRREFDQWTLDHYHGALTVNLATLGAGEADLRPGAYSASLTRLHSELARSKAQRLGGVLRSEAGWNPVWVRPEGFEGERVCAACRRFAATRKSQKAVDNGALEADICRQCAAQLEVGRRLTRAKWLSFWFPKTGPDGKAQLDAAPPRGGLNCLGVWVVPDQTPDQGAALCVHLNDPDVSAAPRSPVGFRYMTNHVPREKDDLPNKDWPKGFDAIAFEGAGDSQAGLLGVLKADVDRLGAIFQEGLRRDGAGLDAEPGFDSPARISALSRHLEYFFSGWLQKRLSEEDSLFYAVYSGGDDLMVIGPRYETFELAIDIEEAFRNYVGNPAITISAGLAVVKHREPIAHTADEAEELLDNAKNAGRDRLCILDATLPWSQLPVAAATIDQLRLWKPPMAYLYALQEAGRGFRRYREKKTVAALAYHPRLTLQIGRNIDRAKSGHLWRWSEELLQYPPQGEVLARWETLPFSIGWIVLDLRELAKRPTHKKEY